MVLLAGLSPPLAQHHLSFILGKQHSAYNHQSKKCRRLGGIYKGIQGRGQALVRLVAELTARLKGISGRYLRPSPNRTLLCGSRVIPEDWRLKAKGKVAFWPPHP